MPGYTLRCGAKSRALGSIVVYARAKAREHSCSHALRKGYSSPQQPLKTKVETRSNSPVPLKAEMKGALRLHPTGGLFAWVWVYVIGSHLLI